MSIEKLKFDKKNFNKHTEFGMSLLEKSLRQNGAGRSILVDKDDNIIAGNGIVEAAVNAGITKTKVVEVTGDELVVVKRTDLELDSKAGREMALADNATAAVDLAWDFDELQKAVDEFDINPNDWGVIMDFDESEEDEKAEVYSRKIEPPTYEPTDITPTFAEMYNTKKRDELLEEIKKAKVDGELYEFLCSAAYRHTIFNYEKIADYYANASKEIQQLFENSALVIIDFESAIANGFVRLTKELAKQYAIEREVEDELNADEYDEE